MLHDTTGGDLSVLLDLPASVIRSDMEDIVEEFLERVGASVDTGSGWPGVWLLLNRWLEGGIIVPDAWSSDRLRRGFFLIEEEWKEACLHRVAHALAWSPPHMAALARREVKDHGNGRFLAALTHTWAERGHHMRGMNGAVRLTYAEAWMSARVDEREHTVPYLDFAANRWNSQLILCAFIENQRHEALVAVERALAVGDTIVLTPWMAVAVIVENLPAHARDVVNLTLREPFTLIQDHAGLPVSAFQSLLGTCPRLSDNISSWPVTTWWPVCWKYPFTVCITNRTTSGSPTQVCAARSPTRTQCAHRRHLHVERLAGHYPKRIVHRGVARMCAG